MPDLTNDPIGANYRRAEQKFSNFGTRRLRFYTIEVAGYNAYLEGDTEENSWNYETTGINGDDDYYAYKNPPGSIIEAILRGVALVAETYYVSWYHVSLDGDDYPYTYITVAVAGDTFLDGINQYLQPNGNAYSLQNAVADALGNDFIWDAVFVWAREIQGQNLVYDTDGPPYALNRTPGQMSEEQKSAMDARKAGSGVAKVSRRR
jgi:hypothetical protein